MMPTVGLLVLVSIAVRVSGETVYLEDVNGDHERRNLDHGLPEMMNFQLRHEAGTIELQLKENKRLGANAPVTTSRMDANGNTRTVAVDLPQSKSVKFYQDMNNGAFFTVECVSGFNGPCTRVLTGNLHIGDKEYKIEPKFEDDERRELNAHLGTAHSMELLERTTLQSGGIKSNGQEVTVSAIADLDYIVQPEATEEPPVEANLLEGLLRRLEEINEHKNRQKRAIVAHGIEMLMVIDHTIYQMFAEKYTGEETILLKIRQYYSHIINGVDLRYASIQESDVSFYVTVAGFFVSKQESDSPWMDYSGTSTDAMAGLKNMMAWRKSTELTEHDHACLMTKSNIQAKGFTNVRGVSYLKGVCKEHGVSINEEAGLFIGAGIVSHELGHNLGSPHDSGSSSSGCWSKDGYIMQPYVPSMSAHSTSLRPWRFSPCSIESFRNYVNSLGEGSCTLGRASVYDDGEFHQHTSSLAGQLYTEDEQCELLRGKGATMCPFNKNGFFVCRELRCRFPGEKTCKKFVAAHGTPCGTNKMCFEGRCQDIGCVGRNCGSNGSGNSGNGSGESSGSGSGGSEITTTAATDTTTELDDNFYCYDRGVTGMSCNELLNFFGDRKSSLCRRFYLQCCSMCSIYCRRDLTIRAGKSYTCSQLIDLYGRKTACSLFPKTCCKTCAP